MPENKTINSDPSIMNQKKESLISNPFDIHLYSEKKKLEKLESHKIDDSMKKLLNKKNLKEKLNNTSRQNTL